MKLQGSLPVQIIRLYRIVSHR